MSTKTDTVSQVLHELAIGNRRTRPVIIIQNPRPTTSRPPPTRPRTKKTTVRISKRRPGVRVTKRVVAN